jgi:hypothetical protein
MKVIREASETDNAVLVAREHVLSSSMVSKWLQQYKQYGEAAFKRNNKGNGQLVVYSDYHTGLSCTGCDAAYILFRACARRSPEGK